MTVKPLICIVDDAADYRSLVEIIFKRYLPDYSLHLFADGQSFLNALPQLSTEPHLILLDQRMPRLNGYQTLVALKQNTAYQHIPVVMISADASASEIESFYEAGARGSQIKPTSFDALMRILETVLFPR